MQKKEKNCKLKRKAPKKNIVLREQYREWLNFKKQAVEFSSIYGVLEV